MFTFKANIRHRGREYINSKLTDCAVGPPRGKPPKQISKIIVAKRIFQHNQISLNSEKLLTGKIMINFQPFSE